MTVELGHITWQGPDADDPAILDDLPTNLRGLLAQVNGFIQFGGGLHLRGASLSPDWHSLRVAWHGPRAFHRLYPTVDPSWIPFAQDCVGDQFLLADGGVLRLLAETGEVEPLAVGLAGFLQSAMEDPVEWLLMAPLLQMQAEGGGLEPGQLVHAYPPFCCEEAAGGVSLKAVPTTELHAFHAELSAGLPETGRVLVKATP